MSSRILGIDPGSRVTGFGVIEVSGNRLAYVASGCVRVQGEDLGQRLKCIFDGIQSVVRQFGPDAASVEQVFVRHNVASALKLGQARGAAICAAAAHGVDVFEYTPASVKQAVVGSGRADKSQVQFMIKTLLNLSDFPQQDAADALACAVCHHHTGSRRLLLREYSR